MKITREIFIQATGYEPIEDDLERCNCKKDHHFSCGWNNEKNMPVFMVGKTKEQKEAEKEAWKNI